MKQYEAVIQTLENLGGQATLGELNQEVLKIDNCEWKTKTPFASIRRIVQTRPEIIKIRPGLWALKSFQKKLGITEYEAGNAETPKSIEENHSYYLGIIAQLGNLRGYSTFIPNQDKNRVFVNKLLSEVRSLSEIPMYSHPEIVKRSGTIDVIWFNSRKMPSSFFEVEHSTDIQNSLLKFCDLQDFFSKMVIVADERRHQEFDYKIRLTGLSEIKNRVEFLGYSNLIKLYEHEVFKSSLSVVL
ncbi:MAG: hypothetical protein ACYDH2_09825 [Anaerolineaceae bacterium]